MSKTSRRNFIVGAASAASLLSSSISKSDERTDKPLGVALCGLGSLSTDQIAPALQKTQHCRLAGHHDEHLRIRSHGQSGEAHMR